MNEKLQRLYDTLQKDGYELSSFDVFSQDMTDSVKAKRLYSTMTTDGYELPATFENFHKDIFPSQVDDSTVETGWGRAYNPKEIISDVGDHAGAVLGAINRGVTQTITAPLKLEGALEQATGARNPLQSITEATGLVDEGAPWATRAGQAIEDFTNKLNPRYDNVNDTLQSVAEGVGQVGGIIATGGIGAARPAMQAAELAQGVVPATGRVLSSLGKQSVSPVGISTGAQVAVPEWEAAKAAGLSDDDAFKTLVKNYLVGQTEAIPIENVLSRLNKITNGAIMERVKTVGVGGLSEFVQEGVQTYLTNEIAKSDYDPDRDPMFQVLESATVGGIVGLLIPAIGGVMQKTSSPELKQKLAQKIITLDINQEIAKADSGDPVVNATIDNQTNEITTALSDIDKTVLPVVAPAENTETISAPEAKIKPLTAKEKTLTKNYKSFSPEDHGKAVEIYKKKIINTPDSPKLNLWNELLTLHTKLSQQSTEPARPKPTDLVNEFDNTGAMLGITEESKKETKAVASEQIADFLRGKVESRGEVTDFQDQWNQKHPERVISNKEALDAWSLIRPAKPAPTETITQPINEALKDQVKTFYRGMDKGIRKGQKLVNENLLPKVQEALKTAKLSPRQTSAIINKVKTSNLFTPGSQSKLTTFIDKVVGDAQYAEKLAGGRSLQKRVKKFGRQKSEKIPVNYKILARSFGQINPNEVTDLDEYQEKANTIIGAFRPVTAENYAPVNVTETEDYIDKVLATQDEEQEKVFQESDEKDLSELQDIAQSSADRLTTKDLGGLDERGKKAVDTINKIDVKQLDGNQLKRYVKIVDNIVENDDLSGEAFIENLAAVQTFIKEFDTLTKGKRVSEIGMWGRTMYNMSNMLKRLYQNDKIESFFRSNVHGPVLTAGSQVESSLVDASEKFDKTLKSLNKKYQEIYKDKNFDLRDIDNKADLMVFSLLYQMDNESDIAKVQRNIKETIKRHEEVGNEEEANAWKQAFKKFDGVVNEDQVRHIIKKQNPAVYEMWQMFGFDGQKGDPLFTEEIANEQARVAKEIYNREYVPSQRYTPIVQHDVNTLYRTSKTIEDGGENTARKTLNPKQARTAKRRTLNLAANKVYTLEPYTDWILRYGETIYDNKASKAEAKMAELIRHPEFTKLVGGQDNALALAGAFERMVSIQRGTNRLISDNEAESFFTELAKTVRSVGTIKALASASQAVKQSTVAVKLFSNLMVEGDTNVLPAAIHAAFNPNSNVKKLLDQSTLIARGLRMGGTDRGTSEAYKLQRGARRKFFKLLEKSRTRLDKRTRASLSFLVKPDVFNARVAFLSYYLQNLKHQGIKDVDLNKEHEKQDQPERKEAMAFAENMVEKTQTASNPAAMSAIQAQTQSKGWEFVKTVFLPFSTFDVDFKARLVNEISALRREPTSNNAVRLGGTVGEALTFAALNAFILYWYKEALRNAIAGLTDNEREEKSPEKINKEQTQQFLSSITGALNPLAIGTVPQELQARAINEVGYQIAKADNEDLTKKEWLKENALVYEPREGSLLENLGAYSTGISPLQELFKTIPQYASVFGEPITVVDAYGNEKTITLTKDQQKILVLKTLAEGLTLAGLTEADVANAIRTVYREQMKQGEESPKKNSNKFEQKKKSFNR